MQVTIIFEKKELSLIYDALQMQIIHSDNLDKVMQSQTLQRRISLIRSLPSPDNDEQKND